MQIKQGISKTLGLVIFSILIIFVIAASAVYYFIYSDTATKDKYDKYDEMAEILAKEAAEYKRNKATAQDVVISFDKTDRELIVEMHKNPQYLENGDRDHDVILATYERLLNSDKEIPLEEQAWLEQRLGQAYIAKYLYRRDPEAIEKTIEGYRLLKAVSLNELYPMVVRADAARNVADSILVDMNMDIALEEIYVGPIYGDIIANYGDRTSMGTVMLSSGDLYRYSTSLYREPDAYFAAALVYFEYLLMAGHELDSKEIVYLYGRAQEEYKKGSDRLDTVVERFDPRLELYEGSSSVRIGGYFRQRANALRRMYLLQTDKGDAISQAEYISSQYDKALEMMTEAIPEERRDAFITNAGRVAANYGVWLYQVYGTDVPSDAQDPEELVDIIFKSEASKKYFADSLKSNSTQYARTSAASFGALSPRFRQYLIEEAELTNADFESLELPNRGLMKPRSNQ